MDVADANRHLTCAGQVTNFDTHDCSARHVPVELDEPPEWEPETEEAQAGLIGVPRFVSARAFVLALPSGEERCFRT
jgi:hypothetical protein